MIAATVNSCGGTRAVSALGKRQRQRATDAVCYSSFEAAAELREEWDDLALRCGGDVFNTFDWCRIWWKHYGQGRQLYIQAYREENGSLVAVLPLFREDIRLGPLRLRVLRLVGCDHGVTTTGFLVAPEQTERVAAEFGRRLHGDRSWDLVQLAELPGYSEYPEPFSAALAASAQSLQVTYDPKHYPQMLFHLPADYEEYLGKLSGTERSNIRKRQRRLAESHQATEVNIPPGEVSANFAEFVRQHEAQWHAEGQLGHFGDWPGSREFQEEIAKTHSKSGRMLLVRVAADGETIGYQYNLIFNGRVHWITSSRTLNPRWEAFSPGRLLHCATVKAAIAAGAAMLDGLGGYYEFKRRLGAQVVGLQSVTIVRRGGASRARLRAFVAATRTVDGLYHRLWYWHAAPWLRRRIPPTFARMLSRGLRTRFIRGRFLVAGRLPRSLRSDFASQTNGSSHGTDA